MMKVLEDRQIPTVNKNSLAQKSEDFLIKTSVESLKKNNSFIIQIIYKLSQEDGLFYENLKEIIHTLPNLSLEETFYNVLEYFSFFLCVSDMQHKLPFLAIAPDPYLPNTSKKYTLVIDIVNVCCLKSKKSKNLYRPNLDHFLSEMSQYFEIVSFVNCLPNQIDETINQLDRKKHIKYRLYKHHGVHVPIT